MRSVVTPNLVTLDFIRVEFMDLSVSADFMIATIGTRGLVSGVVIISTCLRHSSETQVISRPFLST